MASPSMGWPTDGRRSPDPTAGTRRPPTATSSPNTAAEKETEQMRKRLKQSYACQLFESEAMAEDFPNLNSSPGSPQVKGTEPPPSAWTCRRLFSELIGDDAWYVAESDSEEVAETMKDDELDDMIPDDDDPLCPTIPFKAMEKIRYWRKWRSSLIVKVLDRYFPFSVLSKRLETLWAKHGGLQIYSLSFGFYVVCFTSQMDYEQAAAGGPWMIGGHYLNVRPWRKGFPPAFC
ncbi:unnamed protein product [Linum trigynum]|uniref:DUF4283 domain-containing protein n=1 Tax=Linum trigynum TaxID=586398 RepID=A0AAV2DCG1_9ROSI